MSKKFRTMYDTSVSQRESFEGERARTEVDTSQYVPVAVRIERYRRAGVNLAINRITENYFDGFVEVDERGVPLNTDFEEHFVLNPLRPMHLDPAEVTQMQYAAEDRLRASEQAKADEEAKQASEAKPVVADDTAVSPAKEAVEQPAADSSKLQVK